MVPETASTVLDNLKAQGIIDDNQYKDINVNGKIGAVAALSNPNEGIDGDYNISLLACEQL